MDQEVPKGCSLLAQHLCNSRFEILTAVLLKMHIFWDMRLCQNVRNYWAGTQQSVKTSELIARCHYPDELHPQPHNFNTCNNITSENGIIYSAIWAKTKTNPILSAYMSFNYCDKLSLLMVRVQAFVLVRKHQRLKSRSASLSSSLSTFETITTWTVIVNTGNSEFFFSCLECHTDAIERVGQITHKLPRAVILTKHTLSLLQK
jgi:hypothetical protein